MKCPNCGKSDTLKPIGKKYYYPVINENENMSPSEALVKRYFFLALLIAALLVFGYSFLTRTYVPRGGYPPVRANDCMMVVYIFIMIGIGYLIKAYISEIKHINRVKEVVKYSCEECSWRGNLFMDNHENNNLPEIIEEK